jgi:hypothetical protein
MRRPTSPRHHFWRERLATESARLREREATPPTRQGVNGKAPCQLTREPAFTRDARKKPGQARQ